jgi:hypothetical protein
MANTANDLLDDPKNLFADGSGGDRGSRHSRSRGGEGHVGIAQPRGPVAGRRALQERPMRRASLLGRRLAVVAGVVIAVAIQPQDAEAKSLIDFFKPTPIVGQLTSNAWGASGVLPRDQDNGLEDRTMKSWAYWDGKILKAADGKYHLFASRWGQGAGHNGWFGSQCVHAVSDTNLFGPYVDQGNCYTDNPAGHNVTAGQFADGTYAILISETRRPATFYTSRSLEGPFTQLGGIQIDANGFSGINMSDLSSNTTMMLRSDGAILMVARAGITFLDSTNNPLGPYKVQSNTTVLNQAGADSSNTEDPCIWYSGGQYHTIFNDWAKKKAYHFMSKDGVHGWKNMGIAYDPRMDFIRYTDGTMNHWAKLERPGIYMEGGHVAAFTFAAIDVEKEDDKGNDNHGSKIIVVPFDGRAFDVEISGEVDDGGTDAGTDGPAYDGGGADGSAQDGGGADGPAQDGGRADGPAQDGGRADGPAHDAGSTVAQDAGDGPGRDGGPNPGDGGGLSDAGLQGEASEGALGMACESRPGRPDLAAAVLALGAVVAARLRRTFGRSAVPPGPQ